MSDWPIPGMAASGAAHEQQRTAGPHPADGVLGHGNGQPQMRIEIAVRTLAVEGGQGRIVRAGARDHHVADRPGKVSEEPVEGGRVGGVEGRGALRAQFQRRLLEPVGIAAGEDDIGTLGPGTPGCLEPGARAAADHDNGLSGQFRFALGGGRNGCAGHDSSNRRCGHRSSVIGHRSPAELASRNPRPSLTRTGSPSAHPSA